ncbi:DUF805 domain-containing protein [Streptomyces mirabilis]|uniref:DUF805 domain-containing protein n=1 Tax=Streptomyces mirabilis TaxID=68239 RepID=UPI003660A1E9
MTSMSFADAARTCLTTKYATFAGRARRTEYWWFSVVYVIATMVIVGGSWAVEVPLLSVLLLVFIVPMLSVSVRRLHDTGRSGRWMFIALIPVVGPVLYLVGMAVDSMPGTNQYGPSPKAADHPVG